MVEPKGKGTMNPLKRRAESGILGGKLMADTMKGIRTSRRLASLQAHSAGGTSGGMTGKVAAIPQEVDKGSQGEDVYIPCWNVNNSSQLTLDDEKSERVDNITPPAGRTKFEIYKEVELGNRLDHSIYEVMKVLRFFCKTDKFILECQRYRIE